jgi:hypothetical protein
MVQLSANRCSCIAILWVSLVIFAAMTLCVASQWVFIVVVYFVIDEVRKLLDTPSYSLNTSYRRRVRSFKNNKSVSQSLYSYLWYTSTQNFTSVPQIIHQSSLPNRKLNTHFRQPSFCWNVLKKVLYFSQNCYQIIQPDLSVSGASVTITS